MIGNVGIIFTHADLNDVREIVAQYKVPAAARMGLLAPKDVFVPAGPTGMDPSQTSFFQALNIATKINKGSVEILSNVHLIIKGERVGSSAAVLLQKLGIKPFEYGLEIQKIYENGSVYDPAVLDLTDDDLLQSFQAGVSRVSALSLMTGYPVLSAIPHIVINAYKNLLAISIATDYDFEQAKELKELLNDPEKMAAMQVGIKPRRWLLRLVSNASSKNLHI